MDNIIECRLDSTCKEIYTGIWQHDYGQILRITGVDLPKAVEVQFSLRDKGGDTLTRIGTTVDGVTEVKVPDSFLKNENCTQNYLIYAWIYVTDDASGNTEYQIILHVKSRPKPEEPSEEPLPEPNIFHETVEAVNASADRAETAEKNAKASETEAGKYAASASESATAAEKTKEDALREVGEKKQEAIEAIQEQEETSVGKITTHTDDEIQRIQDQTAESKGELEQSITNAGASKKELDESIQIASDTKTALDKSVELAGTAKTGLDTSIREAGEAKTALNGSAKTAGEMQETLNETAKQAGALDTSLNEKIETGTQLNEDITSSGEKAIQDIQNAGSEQLGKMQAVAEEFTADREQVAINKKDIDSLKEDLSQLSEEVENLKSGGNNVGTGITTEEKTLILSLLKASAYNNPEMQTTYDALESKWMGSGSGEGEETVYYTVTNTLTNVTSSNSTGSVVSGASYNATLTANEGYNLDSVTVTMDGSDITATAYTNGVVAISNVTGNVVITATASATQEKRTVYFASDESVVKNDGYMNKTGTIGLTTNVRYKVAEIPYTEGMLIHTYCNFSTINDYPPFIFFDGTNYTVPEYTTPTDYNCEITLSGQTGIEKVYVNMFGTTAGVFADERFYYVTP